MWQFEYCISPISPEEQHNVTMYSQGLHAISLNLDLCVWEKNNQNTTKRNLKLLFKWNKI